MTKARARVGKLPLWGIGASVLVLFVVLAVAQRRAWFAGGTGGATSHSSAAVENSESAPTASAPAPTASASQGISSSHRANAEVSDLAALKSIENTIPSSRSAADVLTLARGHRTIRRDAVRELGDELRRQPALATDASTQRRLIKLAGDPEVAIEALGVIADLAGPVAADLLFELWQAAPAGSASALIAEDLLRSRDVRPRASEALSLLLDLRDAQSCIARRALMPRAIEHADARAVLALEGLALRTGCGEKKDADCNPCLREGEWLSQATDAAQDRKAPIDMTRLMLSH